MPSRCVLGRCPRSTAVHGVSLHRFPKDPAIRSQWTKFVGRTRKDFNPDHHARPMICSAHFEESCFSATSLLKVSLGICDKAKPELIPEAVPTILAPLLDPSKKQLPVTNVGADGDETVSSVSQKESQKKTRGERAKKRERKRTISDLENNVPCQSEIDLIAVTPKVARVSKEKTLPLESMDTNFEMLDANTFQTASCQTVITGDIQKKVKIFKRSKQVQTRAEVSNKSSQCQHTPTMSSVGCQFPEASAITSSTSVGCQFPETLTEEIDEESDSFEGDVDDSPDYIPDEEEEDTDQEVEEETQLIADFQPSESSPEPKYMVFATQLKALLGMVPCSTCLSFELTWTVAPRGSYIKVTGVCSGCGDKVVWESQPIIGRTPAGNILISCAVLTAGLVPSKAFRFLEQLGLKSVTVRAFFRHQASTIIPAINTEWAQMQDILLAQKKNVVVGGDGRNDSPGHSAKYGSYTLLDLDRNVVLAIELMQSNQCGGSFHMEIEGLKKAINRLKDADVSIELLVTDRHPQITKWLREKNKGIKHKFDIWHVAKGLGKKWDKASQPKPCQPLKPWKKSVVNHLYWSAVSSPADNGKMMVGKWTSIANHLQNIHTGHGEHFNECLHGPLIGIEANKQWIEPHSAAADRLLQIVNSKPLLKSIENLSPKYQTSSLESFHALNIRWAPKSSVFSFHAMEARLQLSAIHHNSNANRKQAVTKTGELRCGIGFPKAKGGDYVLKEIKEDANFEYVSSITRRVLEATANNEKKVPKSQPPSLCASFYHPTKEEARKRHVNRFEVFEESMPLSRFTDHE